MAHAVELVSVNASDGLRLDGCLREPDSAVPHDAPLDAWLLIHGTGSNFYSSRLLAAARAAVGPVGGRVARQHADTT